MSGIDPARDRVARQLHDAVERLRDDMDRVEFWIDVLGCFTRPVPDYDAGKSKLDQFSLPRRPASPPRGDDSASRDAGAETAISPRRAASNEGPSRR